MIQSKLLVDSHGRTLRDLRISITDRCNFRCLYCLPETEAARNFYRGHWAHLPDSAPIVQQWVPKSNILSFEEIERVIRIAVDLGIRKVRLTGGEPLLRHHVEDLVARVARIPGIEDLAMTTNGFLFAPKARALRDAGLRRVTFSLDSLDRANFRKMTGRDGLREVLQAIGVAQSLGFSPVKINAVIIRGINDHEIEALAAFAREGDLSLRFIEFMPLDSARAWQKEMVVTGREIFDRLQRQFGANGGSAQESRTAKGRPPIADSQSPIAKDHSPMVRSQAQMAKGQAPIANSQSPMFEDQSGMAGRESTIAGRESTTPRRESAMNSGESAIVSGESAMAGGPSAIGYRLSAIPPLLVPVVSENKSETAKRWRFADGRAEIGVIAPVSEPFCGHCNRIRLTADGKVRTCLFSVTEHDLRSRLRNGESDAAIARWLQEIVLGKEARHHIGEPEFVPPPRSMSCIGG